MVARALIALGVLVYAVLVPFLEINSSHVFNPLWPPHARFHEVWQLTTNVFIGILALWLAFKRNEIQTASVLNIAIMGGALSAHALEKIYGGSIISGNISRTVLGMEVAAFAAVLVVIFSVTALLLAKRRKAHQRNNVCIS